tara:strand:- start:2056 stop:3126 length:1071 start_codon:yes stop_codon:yes gene_type:complete
MKTRDLSGHREYSPGKSTKEVAKDIGRGEQRIINLSSNENPIGPSPNVVKTLRDKSQSVNRYPKEAAKILINKIAEKWGVTESQIWLSNGGDGAIDYLSRAMIEPNDGVLVPNPGFAYYGMSAMFHHGCVDEYYIGKSEEFKLSAKNVLKRYNGQKIIYLTSPNNPTGGVFPIKDIKKIIDEIKEDSLVVIDEAYGEYCDEKSAIKLHDDYQNVAIIRTFSKAYGLAGCRIGYAIVPERGSGAYTRVSTPFAVGELSCHAAMAALGDEGHLEKTVNMAKWSREYMRKNMDMNVMESHANFVLVEVGDANEVFKKLKMRGIVVRDCTSFGMPEYIRVTCGDKKQTEMIVKEINNLKE